MHVQFQEKTLFLEEPEGSVVIKSPWVSLKCLLPTPAQYEVLRLLAKEGIRESTCEDFILKKEGSEGLMRMYSFLIQFKKRALVTLTAMHEEKPLLSLIPLSSTLQFDEAQFDETALVVLSTSCYSYFQNHETVLETPLQTAKVILKTDEMVAFIRSLFQPITLSQLALKMPMLPLEVLAKCLKLLQAAKILKKL